MTTRTELLERAPAFCLPGPGERALCAVSGGLDSMCLLYMLCAWRAERGGQIAAAHFNHGLRGAAADRDEAFVRETCEKWGVPLTTGRGDVRGFAGREGLSVEEAARILRYDFLKRAAEERGCALICAAHHAGDNAETVLLNLIRGTGLRGLGGMERRRGMLCRPLLDVTRAELEDYAARWGVPHIEDETNADPEAASRNFMRLRVMPLLRELNPKAAEHIARTAAQVQEVDRYLDEQARRAFTGLGGTGPGWVALPWEDLRTAPPPLRPRLLALLLERLEADRKDFGAVHFDAILRLENERSIDLPHGVTARRERGRLFLTRRKALPGRAALEQGPPLIWGGYTLALLDHREGEGLALRLPAQGESGVLTVAPAPPGDRLTLPGAKGSRSVKRLCLDLGVSLAERDRLPALYADGKLAAVWRLGVDTAFAPEGEGPCRFIKIMRHIEEEKKDAQRNGE